MSTFNDNATTWFEIPTLDINRAAAFYEQVLGIKLNAFEGDEPYRLFPKQGDGVGGGLVQRERQKPSSDGTLIYLNADGKLNASLERAADMGATILVPRTEIPGVGSFFACIKDSEGNHIGLHSSGE